MTESKRRSNIKKIQARQRRYHALGRCWDGRELRAGYKRCANCLARLAQRDGSGSSISIAIGSLLAFLVAWGLLGCSLTGNFLAKDRTISFDIDALLGASPEVFEAQLKDKGEIWLVYERRREADNAPKGSSAGEPFHKGTVLQRTYRFAFADSWGPEVKVSFHRTDARAYRIVIDYNKYVSKIDALERLGFDWSALRESPVGAYKYLTWTEGRVWLIDRRSVHPPVIHRSQVPTDGTELCLISLWGPVSGRRRIPPSDLPPNNNTSVNVQIYGR